MLALCYLILGIYHFSFEGRTLILIVPVPGHFYLLFFGVSCEQNNQLNVCTTSVTEVEVARVKLV